MDIEALREYCLRKPYTTEETPFGPDTLVFKVYGKLFCAFNIQTFESVNLKCDPEYAIELRAEFAGVEPGFHMNKKHWNTIRFDTDVSPQQILRLVDHSFEMVVKKLPKKHRDTISA